MSKVKIASIIYAIGIIIGALFFDVWGENTTDDWKKENLKDIKKRLTGWQLESFEESYTYKIKNGISLFKKKLKNE